VFKQHLLISSKSVCRFQGNRQNVSLHFPPLPSETNIKARSLDLIITDLVKGHVFLHLDVFSGFTIWEKVLNLVSQ